MMYSKDDYWVKCFVLVSGLDFLIDSIDLSQVVNIVRQVVFKRKENMNFNIVFFFKFVLFFLILSVKMWDYMVFREIGR